MSDHEQQRSNPLQLKAHHSHESEDEEPEIAAGAKIDEDNSDEEHEEIPTQDTPDQATPSTRPSTPQSTSNKAKPTHLTRGKRNKAKRAAKKYAEQDDEDRALVMQLLGSNRAQEQKKEAETEKAAKEAKAQADRERRKAQHAKAAEKERARHERLEKAAAAGEEGGSAAAGELLDEDDELSTEQLAQERLELLSLDRLIPLPLPGDELLAAIPVVAPWPALSRQKYKIKLQPGNLKKGKAVKEILGLWTSLGTRGPRVVDEANREKEKVWRREVELLKEWRVEEVVGSVPVKGCRVVQGGGLGGGGGAGAGGGGKGKSGAGAKGRGGGGKKGR